MRLLLVNEDANYIVQLFVDNKWQTLTGEFSVSAATNVASNAHVLTNLSARVTSKRSNNMVLCEMLSKN
jgi:hypothetical protein